MIAALVAVALLAVVATGLAWRATSSLRRTRDELRLAHVRLGEALAASGESTIVRVALDAALALTSSSAALYWLDRGPSLETRYGADARRVERGRGVVGAVAAGLEPVRWPPGPPPDPQEPQAGAALAVPVKVRGRLNGILALYRDGRPFDDAELADVLALAGQAATAIDTTYRHDETRKLSLTDGLTGLWNRRQFELRISQELERAARFGERFSVVLVDLDDFKAVNDTHGHLVGDAVLVEAAQRLMAHTREVDTVARYGGEEFVLLLPQTDGEGAVKVADKVRAELADAPVPTDAGPLGVTLSAGVACHPDHGATMEALLAAADDALYAAKAAGKNRVVHADVHEHGAAPA